MTRRLVGLLVVVGTAQLGVTLARAQTTTASVTTGSAVKVISTQAAAQGSVNPNGIETDYRFQYGQTTSYGHDTTWTYAGSGSSAVQVQQTLEGLGSGTTYHFRIQARYSVDDKHVVSGADGTFETQVSAPVPPSNAVLPSLSGTPQQGDTLTASPGTWDGDAPMTLTYRWSDGATGQTDTLGASDVGQNITVTVTAANDAGSANAPSYSVGPVTADNVALPLWTADGSQSLSNEWAEFSTATNCAVDTTGLTDPEAFQESSVVAPYSPHDRAYKFTVSQSDRLCYSGNRTELGEAYPQRGDSTIGSGRFSASRYFLSGHDYWVSTWLLLGSNWPLSDGHWDNVMQFKFLCCTSAAYPIALVQVFSRHIWFVDANTNQYWDLGAVSTDVWMKLTLHFFVSSNPSVGYMEVYGSLTGGTESQLLPKTFLATTAMCSSSCSDYGLPVGVDMPLSARVGIYRNSVIPGSATDYFDGYSVATSRASAEISAFGS